jgi:Amt family ammonium transporter
VQAKEMLGIDDSLDVWGVHGVGGMWGALATGIFASTAVNPDGANGLLFGNPGQLLIQLLAVVVVSAYSMAVTWIILKALDVTIGLRVEEQEELSGLDVTQHGEVAYQL